MVQDNKAGVYVLLDAYDSFPDSTRTAYIGESMRLFERFQDHKRDEKKRFWEDTIVVVRKDDTLTKAHAEYVESQLIKAAHQNPSWSLPNNTPDDNAGSLPVQHRLVTNQFVDEAKMLIGVLGCDLFRSPRCPDGERGDQNKAATFGQEGKENFFFKGGGFEAKMRVGSSGLFIVEKGSLARVDLAEVPRSVGNLRQAMQDRGDLREDKEGKFLVFQNDYGFKSLYSAAAVVGGGNRDGRTSWRLADGTEYGKWEAAKSVATTGREDR